MTKTQQSKDKTVPWYYPVLIKILKPLYRFTLWRKHKKAKFSGTPIANFHDELNARFGHQFPSPPKLSQLDNLPIAGTTNQANTSKLENSSKLPNQLQQPEHSSIFNIVERLPISPCSKKQDSSKKQGIFYNTTIWCHAVSLGETNTIAPMLNVLIQRGAKIWLTNTTQTGFARSKTLFSDAMKSQQMVHTFIPVDDRSVVEKFIDVAKPNLAMFVETELWVTTLDVLNQCNIPSVLVNARLSEKSFKRYQKFAAISGSMMANISLIIAQDGESAERFRKLGAAAHKIRRADSLKWSTGGGVTTSNKSKSDTSPINHILSGNTPVKKLSTVQDPMITTNASGFAVDSNALDRPIWVAGSTHDNEEYLAIKAHQSILKQTSLQHTLLLVVPRHPERFDEVALMLEQTKLKVHRRSQGDKIRRDTQVYLVDTMGELERSYEIADVAFVGGSLVNIGGHNPIEASRLGKPVIMGAHTNSCDTLVTALEEAGGLHQIAHSDDSKVLVESLQRTVAEWLTHTDKAIEAGRRGQRVVQQKQGAMAVQLNMIEGLLAHAMG